MKFIVKGLHNFFDTEISIQKEKEASINQLIKTAGKRTTKGTMMILNAIKNEENIYQLIKDNLMPENEKFTKKLIDEYSSCTFSNEYDYDVLISFKKEDDHNLLSAQEGNFHAYSGMKKGRLEIKYSSYLYEINFSYVSKNLHKSITTIPFELDY
jgi:hypothetical protein